MKIDNSIHTATGIPGGESPKRADKTADPNPPAADAAANVRLSPLSSQLQAIENDLAGSAPVNSARVAEIKQAISDGRFKINADAVADRLLETVRELIQAHRAERN